MAETNEDIALRSALKEREHELLLNDAQDRLRRRGEEVERLRDNMKAQTEELGVMQTRLSGSHQQLIEVENKLYPLQLQVNKLTREKELLEKHVESMESNLSSCRKELNEVRKKSADSILDKDWTMSSMSSELESNRMRMNYLDDKTNAQEDRINGFLEEIASLEMSIAAASTARIEEIDKKNAAIDLYKQSYDDVLVKMEMMEKRGKLFRESSEAQIADLQAECHEQLQRADDLLTQERKSAALQIAALEQQINEISASRSGANALVPLGSTHIVLPDVDSLDAAELYNRAARAEHELNSEQMRRREAEQYLEHILKDVERKAPVIAGQKREYLRMKDTYGKLTHQLDAVLADCLRLHTAHQKAETDAMNALEKVSSLDQQNRDLSEQVRHLLRQTIKDRSSNKCSNDRLMLQDSADADVISKYLVTFSSIDELQDTNSKLLEIVRRLSQQEDRGLSGDRSAPGTITMTEYNSSSLAETLSELQKMKNARQVAEDMMMELMGQRDEYKEVAERAGLTLPNAGKLSPGQRLLHNDSNLRSANSLELSPHGHAANAKVQELQRKLLSTEEELQKLTGDLAKSEQSKVALTEKLEKEKIECANVKKLQIQSAHDMRIQREAALRGDEQAQKNAMEMKRLIQRYSDMEKKVLELQSNMLMKDQTINNLTVSLQSTGDVKRRAEMELEICKNNEIALIQQTKALEEESKKQSSIIQSVGRFEATLSSRLEEDKAQLTRERDHLAKEVEDLHKQLLGRSLMSDQRIAVFEADMKTCRSELERKAADASQVRLALLREQNSSKVAVEKASVLERQLTIAQERLAAARGIQTLDSSMLHLTNESEIAFERSVAENETLKAQASAAQTHMEQYRKIASDSEMMYKELHQRFVETKEAYDKELNRSLSELTQVKNDFAAFRSTHGSAQEDLERLQKELRDANLKLEANSSQLTEERNTARKAIAAFEQREEELKAEVWRLQQAAKVLSSNYDREREIHAKVESERYELDLKLSSAQENLSSVEQKFADLSADVICRDRAAMLEQSKMKKEAAETAARLDGLTKTRDLLLSQVQMLDAKLTRLDETDFTTSNVSAASSMDPSSRENELEELKRGSAELREVLYFIKRERDTLDAKLIVAETDSARHQATLSATQKALEETRAMLKRESEKLAPMRDENQFEQLLVQVSKLNQMTEMNTHLRKENADLNGQIGVLQKELSKRVSANVPLEGLNGTLTAEKKALEAANAQLVADADQWKERLQHLLSRYKDVDPEDHRALQQNFTTATMEIAEKNAAIVSKEEKLGSLKTTYDNLDKIATGLRTKLRDWKTQREDMQRKLTESAKEADDGKKLAMELTSKISEQKDIIDRQAASIAAAVVVAEQASTAVGSEGDSAERECEVEVDQNSNSMPAPFSSTAPKKRQAPDSASTGEPAEEGSSDPAEILKIYKELLLKKNRSDSMGKDKPSAAADTPVEQAFKKAKSEGPGKAGKVAANEGISSKKSSVAAVALSAGAPAFTPNTANKSALRSSKTAALSSVQKGPFGSFVAGIAVPILPALTAEEEERRKNERAARFNTGNAGPSSISTLPKSLLSSQSGFKISPFGQLQTSQLQAVAETQEEGEEGEMYEDDDYDEDDEEGELCDDNEE